MKKFLCYDTNDAANGKVNVGANGMLKPNSTVPSSSGASYQQLVTDSEGGVKWEDRLAYDDSKLVVDSGEGGQFVKVADEVPSWASVDAPMKVWTSRGGNITVNPESYTNLGNGNFMLENAMAVLITTDNCKVYGIMFPEKGVYFISANGDYVAGVASADSDTPEITWDGNIEMVKAIDPKYIPSELNEIILPSSTPSSSKKFKITVDDSGTITATEV